MNRHRLELVGVALVAGAAGAWMQGRVAGDAHADAASTTVTAQKIILQDPAGNTGLVLDATNPGLASVAFYGSDGRVSMMIQGGGLSFYAGGKSVASYGNGQITFGDHMVDGAYFSRSGLAITSPVDGRTWQTQVTKSGLKTLVDQHIVLSANVRLIDGSYTGELDAGAWDPPPDPKKKVLKPR